MGRPFFAPDHVGRCGLPANRRSRVPTLRNLSLRAPPPPQFRWHKQEYLCQNAHLFVHHLPFVAKRRTIAPHNHPNPPKTPVQTPPAPVTLPPCSNPYRIRTILPSTQTQPATRAREGRPNAHFQIPRTSPPNPPTCPRIPLKPPPKPFPRPPIQPHDPPNAIPKLAEMRGNEREIDLSVLSPRNCKVGTREPIGAVAVSRGQGYNDP